MILAAYAVAAVLVAGAVELVVDGWRQPAGPWRLGRRRLDDPQGGG